MHQKTTLVTAICVLFLLMSTMGAIAQYNESPILAERVASGELPPVEDRLPLRPFIVGPGVLVAAEDLDWQVGQYGGTLRTAHNSPNFSPDLAQGNFEGPLDTAGFDMTTLVPNMVEEFSVNDDNTVFTFRIREGLRWSDGVPVTTEDVRFTYEDVYLNEEIYPLFPTDYRSGGAGDGTPMVIEIMDDYEFVVTFDRPYGAFLTKLSMRWWLGASGFFRPSHYMKQFHIDYATPEELAPYLAEQELEIDEWYNLFSAKDIGPWDSTRAEAIGAPSLYPWIRVPAASDIIRMERNPFYFKVDTEGNQLPYIDFLESREVSDIEAITMLVITGEVDFLREAAGLPRMPLYREHSETAGIVATPMRRVLSPTNMMINYTFENAAWQEVTADVRFRQALSLAVDREEVLDTVYYGLASLPTLVADEFNRYDPEAAKALLDEMGLDQRDEEGYRIGPDGETFDILFEIMSAIPETIPATELFVEYLQDIGLRASMREISDALYGQKGGANELQMTTAWLHPGSWPNVLDDYAPGSWHYGREWATWHSTQGQSGVEPPDWVKRAWEIREANNATFPGSPENLAVGDELTQWVKDYLPFIIVVEEMRHPLITSVNLRNVAQTGFSIPAYMPMEQMFFVE